MMVGHQQKRFCCVTNCFLDALRSYVALRYMQSAGISKISITYNIRQVYSACKPDPERIPPVHVLPACHDWATGQSWP
jgi:hypothetical protein